MTIIQANHCRFIAACDRKSLFPKIPGYEVAFWGRSNVGKSSLLNGLMERSGLARVSKTPGRTQSINFYEVHPALFFVDLPGYGYSEVPRGKQHSWDNLMQHYLTHRPLLACVYVLIDGRRGVGPLDEKVFSFLWEHQIPYGCVLTKMDKVSKEDGEKITEAIRHTFFRAQRPSILKNLRPSESLPDPQKDLFFAPQALQDVFPVSVLKKTGLSVFKERLESFISFVEGS